MLFGRRRPSSREDVARSLQTVSWWSKSSSTGAHCMLVCDVFFVCFFELAHFQRISSDLIFAREGEGERGREREQREGERENRERRDREKREREREKRGRGSESESE
jgi:hypothetical protein